MSTTSTPQPAGTSAGTLPHGRFVWYDLFTSDPAAAQRFYQHVIGWGTEAWSEDQRYTLWTVGEAPIGGTMALPEEALEAGAVPHWLLSVCVHNVDETLEQAQRLGASVLKPADDIPTVGRYAVLADPQGAALAIFSPAGQAPGHEGEPAIGEVSWHELATTDYAAAFTFYRELFGWEKINDSDMGPLGIYREYGQHGIPYGGMFTKPADMPMPPHWLCYIRVRDVNEVVESVKSLGGQLLNGPMEVPGGDFIAQFLDPQGAAFAVHQRKGG